MLTLSLSVWSLALLVAAVEVILAPQHLVWTLTTGAVIASLLGLVAPQGEKKWLVVSLAAALLGPLCWKMLAALPPMTGYNWLAVFPQAAFWWIGGFLATLTAPLSLLAYQAKLLQALGGSHKKRLIGCTVATVFTACLFFSVPALPALESVAGVGLSVCLALYSVTLVYAAVELLRA